MVLLRIKIIFYFVITYHEIYKKQKNYETNKQIYYVSFSKTVLQKMFFDQNKEIIATHIINIGKIKVYNEIKIK